MKLEVKKIGNSTGLILPKELLARLRLDQGDWVYVTETAGPQRDDRALRSDASTRCMKIAREVMKELPATPSRLARMTEPQRADLAGPRPS